MRTRSAKVSTAAPDQPTQATVGSSSLPRLPPEVIARIQALAEEDQSAGEIKKLRARFELVNKEWYGIVDYFTHVVVTQLSDVTRLTTKLRSSKLRALLTAKTKAFTVELREGWRGGEMVKLSNLMNWLPRARRVSIANEGYGVLVGNGTKAGTVLVEALAKMTNLTHFVMSGGRCTPDAIKS